MSTQFQTLAEAVACVGELFPANGFTFQDLRGQERRYSFPEIQLETARRAAALQELGLAKRDRLAMIVAEPEDFVLTFLAALRIGVVPVPVYPPHYLGGLENYSRQTLAILRSSGARVLVASSQLLDIMRSIAERAESLEKVVPAEQLKQTLTEARFPEITPDDLAFLQYTSGSTMEPRGVMVTHRSLVSNIRAFMETGLEIDPHYDSGVSWLPLYHDMGLVGFVLGPVCWGVSVVFIPTLRFIKSASVWLDAIDRHRATITFAPNFAFALAARRVRSAELGRWDLSCLKVLGCGAEPIHPPTIREFMRVFGELCHLDPSALTPAYGLAECTLAVTMKKRGLTMRTRLVDRHVLQEDGIARLAADSSSAMEHVSCGRALSGAEVIVRDLEGIQVHDEVEGEVWLRGPSVAAGYFEKMGAWSKVFQNGWLWTGDRGYLSAGELYITGRSKDLIILNGRNHHPQTIEWMVAELEGVREGNVVAFSRAGELGEELVVVLEVRTREICRLVIEVEDAVHNVVFAKPADVVCVRPGSLPKTSSGKLKRHQLKQDYLRDRLVSQRLDSALANLDSKTVT